MTPEQRTAWLTAITKHGGYVGGKEKPEHYVWRTMRARCNNPNAASYAYYGGRGIKVCKRWDDYAAFIADMGFRPSPDHSLERLNTNLGYRPSNCVWATRSQQQKNKTTTKRYTNGSFTGTLVECAALLNITKHCAFERWKSWGTFEKGNKKWQQLPRAV
jgi:hypothetical protein